MWEGSVGSSIGERDSYFSWSSLFSSSINGLSSSEGGVYFGGVGSFLDGSEEVSF